jgi:alkylation response protein AidB-like acyl-CoA dehydrogenase
MSEATSKGARDPLAIAEELARELALTAVERDRRGGTPKAERDRLRASGLLGLIVPRALGGLGAGWAETLRVVRAIARADGSLAHVFGFQHLMLSTAELFGTREQWEPIYAETAQKALFWGNALNPLDARTRVTRTPGGGYRLDGTKSFCSGALDSDRLVVSAIEEGASRLFIATIPSSRAGLTMLDDWDNMGQRQTDSGTVELRGVEVREEEVLRTPGSLGSTRATLRPCIAQASLVNVYLGLAEGALAEARRYTREQSHAWFASGVERPTEDPYVLRGYGELFLQLEGARALADRAGEALERAWQRGEAITVEERGAAALAIATAKAATTRAGLEVTSRMFELTGARATTARAGLDRFWRNLRTQTLHDPVEYKLRELGEWALNDRLPTPSFYS